MESVPKAVLRSQTTFESARPPTTKMTVPLDPEDTPRLREGIDITRAGLSPVEAFLVSRVDGHTSVKNLALLTGKTLEATLDTAEGLIRAGLLLVGEMVAPATDDPYEGVQFPLDLMIEEADLDEEFRKKVIFTHAKLSEWTHYDLLKVRFRDDAATLKKAFRERSMEWHPDRFHSRKLGAFAPLITDVFKAIREAHEVLSDPKQKRAYDRQHRPSFSEEDMAAVLKEERRERREVRRTEEKKRRRLERNPMRKKMQEARELFERAETLRASGELMEALKAVDASLLLLKERRPEYEKLKRELQAEAAELRIAPMLRRGTSAETMAQWEEAITHFKEAVRLAPDHGVARLRLAYSMLRGGRPPQAVKEHITTALRELPEEPEAHFVRGLCYEMGGMEKAAVRAYENALGLKPNYADAKKRLKKLKWGF